MFYMLPSILVLKWACVFKVQEEPEEVVPEEPPAEAVGEPEPAAPPKGTGPAARSLANTSPFLPGDSWALWAFVLFLGHLHVF